jgi:hypothetical protein
VIWSATRDTVVSLPRQSRRVDCARARAALAVKNIGLSKEKRGMADVLKWWFFFSTNVSGELTFGDSFRTLEQGKVSGAQNAIAWLLLTLHHQMNQYARDHSRSNEPKDH